MKLLIVESPAKASTINKYLGNEYKVLASVGHVRSLTPKDGSVDVNNDFEMKFETLTKASKAIKQLSEVAKEADKIILASDPDREGEAIAWHVLEVLRIKKAIKKDVKIERIVFNEITKKTVENAIKEPRKIDMNLVDAQQARQALDYLVGFNLSPVLWRKLPGSRSAGRVQSVALRLVCDREDEIEAFKKQEYWSIEIELNKINCNDKIKKFTAKLTHINDKKIDKFDINNEKQAKEIEKKLKTLSYKVLNIEKKQIKRNPYPPFTTSTLQQEASKRLGFSAKQTMSVAQKLYENGYITYMRTDGVYTSPESINTARNFIEKKYGNKFLPQKPVFYKNKSKNVQEAHEAIRPTHPDDDSINGSSEEKKLYSLIWKRLIASQMESMVLDQVSVNIIDEDNKYKFRAVGTTVKFEGFHILYETQEEDDDENNGEGKLPLLSEDEKLELQKINTEQHWTEPPPRYNEASLVKKMEELGIGRPSTYASILGVIQDREYVRLEQKRFIPEERGRIVTAFLKKFFSKYVEFNYTAELESNLDEIADGKENRIHFLGDFWKPFKEKVDEVMTIKPSEIVKDISEGLLKHILGVDENNKIKDKCPLCEGTLSLKFGKFGAFVSCGNYPDCKYIKNINTITSASDDESSNKFETKLLGELDGKNVYLKKGPYGFYVQQGEDIKKPVKKTIKGAKKNIKTKGKTIKEDKDVENKEIDKIKRIALPKNEMEPENFTFEKAQMLLNLPELPINLGEYENSAVSANKGRFGPYILHDKTFYSIKGKDVYSIKLDEAIEIIKNKKKK
ncbi:MAG: type I DNA topoisomerase [Rickettsiales bacterium]|jgi:DNA topoisomerase-1|nr:type I DNA topoisomerase [Rickettsiales bacterium]